MYRCTGRLLGPPHSTTTAGVISEKPKKRFFGNTASKVWKQQTRFDLVCSLEILAEAWSYFLLLHLSIVCIITCFTKYSNNLLSYPVSYCSCFRTHIGLLVRRYRTARAPISARSRSSIKMAERPIKPQALNTLTSFYKNKAKKAVKDSGQYEATGPICLVTRRWPCNNLQVLSFTF